MVIPKRAPVPHVEIPHIRHEIAIVFPNGSHQKKTLQLSGPHFLDVVGLVSLIPTLSRPMIYSEFNDGVTFSHLPISITVTLGGERVLTRNRSG